MPEGLSLLTHSLKNPTPLAAALAVELAGRSGLTTALIGDAPGALSASASAQATVVVHDRAPWAGALSAQLLVVGDGASPLPGPIDVAVILARDEAEVRGRLARLAPPPALGLGIVAGAAGAPSPFTAAEDSDGRVRVTGPGGEVTLIPLGAGGPLRPAEAG